MTNKGKILPNTNKHKIFKEFDEGKRPAELTEKYPVTYGTMMVYFENWKQTKKIKNNSLSGLMELIKDIHKPSSTDNKTPLKPIKHTKTKTKPIKPVENPKDIVMIPKEENTRIPEEWKSVERKVRHNPFS